MWKLTLFSVFSGALCVYARGPRANPDDQFRYFSYMEKENPCYEEITAAGFNLLRYVMWGAWDFKKDRLNPVELAARKRNMDRILADGLDYGEEHVFRLHPDIEKDSARILRGGGKWLRNIDVAHPPVREDALNLTRREVEPIADHPAFTYYIAAGEKRDWTRPSFRPAFRKACKAATGADIPPWADLGDGKSFREIPGFPVASRVVPDDDPGVRFYDWFWRHGDGWNDYLSDASAMVKSISSRNVICAYAPAVRTPPLRGTGGNVDLISHWAYPYPEPYNVRYLAAQVRAMGRGRKDILLAATVQGICYRSAMAPKGVKVANPPEWLSRHPDVVYLTAPPDLIQEAFWALFMPRLDVIGTFSVWSYFDIPSRGGQNARGYAFTNPESFGVVSNVMRTVAVPLGPLLRAVPERKAEVAVLESRTAGYYDQRIFGGWGSAWRYGAMFDAAHLQPEVLYEEDLEECGGVPENIKVLLTPYCTVLQRGIVDALKRFQSRGGIIADNGSLPPEILPDVDMEMPPLPWSPLKGLDNLNALRRCALGLKRGLAPYYRPPADSDNDFLITYVRSYGSTDYLFVLNDKRTYGDYVGQWGLQAEKGLPNAGTVTMRRKAGAIYDLVRHKKVGFADTDDGLEIPVSFNTNDGRLLMITDKPLSPLKCDILDGAVEVRSPDTGVMIPVEIRVRDGRSRYGVVKDGRFSCGIPKGSSVTVRNLATGEVFR